MYDFWYSALLGTESLKFLVYSTAGAVINVGECIALKGYASFLGLSPFRG